MKTLVKSTIIAAALASGFAMPALAQQQCGVIVFFPSGQTALGASSRSAIQSFAQSNPGAQFSVTGFSDAPGSASGNLALSETRAQSVASAMTSSTVTAVAGAGEATRPGTSGPADPANRRVEVVNNACPGGLFGVQQTAAADTPFSGAGVAAVAGVGALALGAVLINNDDDNNSGGSTGGTE